MTAFRRSRTSIALLVLFALAPTTQAAENSLPIYFENSKLVVKTETINRTTYLPLIDVLQFMRMVYTDALALETLTIRNGGSRLVLTRNSELISVNDQIVIMPKPMLREDNRWLVPVEFLTQGLSRIAGMDFRRRNGAPRIFAGNVKPVDLVMNAQSLGPITRLTLRVGAATSIGVRRDDPKRTVLTISQNPIDPPRESLDYKDRSIRSIAYDDADGASKIVVETTEEVADVKLTPGEGNMVFFVDFVRVTTAAATPPPEPTPEPAAPAGGRNDVPASPKGPIRVVVLDPGHGGLDAGTRSASVAEKDVTLAIARRLRTALQTRLGLTVLLTRDSDVAQDNEVRAGAANNNQANLFISVHAGYSARKTDASSSIFVMKQDFGGPAAAGNAKVPLFLPWYLGYRTSEPVSVQIGKLLQEELTKAIPGSTFVLRQAPLGVLSSTTMPALVLEIGNLNNPVSAQTLMDSAFQNKLAAAVVSAVQRFAEGGRPAA